MKQQLTTFAQLKHVSADIHYSAADDHDADFVFYWRLTAMRSL